MQVGELGEAHSQAGNLQVVSGPAHQVAEAAVTNPRPRLYPRGGTCAQRRGHVSARGIVGLDAARKRARALGEHDSRWRNNSGLLGAPAGPLIAGSS
ncbi:hypothetical protein CapIbe_012510 [Capra ibex]